MRNIFKKHSSKYGGEHKLWVIYKNHYDFVTKQARKVNIQKKQALRHFRNCFSAFLQSFYQNEERDYH